MCSAAPGRLVKSKNTLATVSTISLFAAVAKCFPPTKCGMIDLILGDHVFCQSDLC